MDDRCFSNHTSVPTNPFLCHLKDVIISCIKWYLLFHHPPPMWHISTQVKYFDSIEGEEDSKMSYKNLYCYTVLKISPMFHRHLFFSVICIWPTISRAQKLWLLSTRSKCQHFYFTVAAVHQTMDWWRSMRRAKYSTSRRNPKEQNCRPWYRPGFFSPYYSLRI